MINLLVFYEHKTLYKLNKRQNHYKMVSCNISLNQWRHLELTKQDSGGMSNILSKNFHKMSSRAVTGPHWKSPNCTFITIKLANKGVRSGGRLLKCLQCACSIKLHRFIRLPSNLCFEHQYFVTLFQN